ncbi:MAG: hypothetical protein ACI9F9_003077 [Candidatus Paceibacteria bacterium]
MFLSQPAKANLNSKRIEAMGRILRNESGSNLEYGTQHGQNQARRGEGLMGRLLLCGVLLPGVLASTSQAGVPGPGPSLTQTTGERTPERYVLAGATGARLMNLPDSKGREVLLAAGGTPLAVYTSRAGSPYLKVGAPGGVKIWVYGKYLQQSQRPGWVEVAGSYVNMRPLPRSQDSYPLGQLDRGDRLRFIQRLDPTKPMSEDWVQVYSPPDTLAYVLAAETRATAAGANPKALWDEAVQDVLKTQPKTVVTTQPVIGGSKSGALEAGAPHSSASQSAGAQFAGGTRSVFSELAAADRSMDIALSGTSTPDYNGLLTGYQNVLALGPDAPTRHLIDQRIERLEAHRELAAIRADIANSKLQREEQLAGLRGEAERGERSNDPLWGRFQTRGWIERQVKDGEVSYLVRWGADFLAKVQCSSGRYELELYEGFEIGIKGVPVRSAMVTTGGYPLIDIDRIEVISARRR